MPLTVTELVARLKRAVEGDGDICCVAGEIGSCKTAGSGHTYFTLKDANAQLPCALYAFRARSMTLRLREGMQVELYGKPTVWEGRGALQFIVERVREAGIGSLQQRFEALKQKLQQEGLFDTARKRPQPSFPQSVVLITSPTGAVIQDMRHRLESRAPWMQAYLYPVQVQGRGAEYGLADALVKLGQPERYGLPRADYLVLARGGGSLEDLWCFNEEVLARAIAACPIPVVSAVGHETDFTIADFVADLRAPTPTAAIELTTPDAAELDAWLQQQQTHLRKNLRRAREMAALRLRAAESGVWQHPMEALVPFQRRLDDLEESLKQALRQRLQQRSAWLDTMEARLSPRALQQRLAAESQQFTAAEKRLLTTAHYRLNAAAAELNTLEARLSAVSPRHALQRGFALVRDKEGHLLRRRADAPSGTPLRILLADGELPATVD